MAKNKRYELMADEAAIRKMTLREVNRLMTPKLREFAIIMATDPTADATEAFLRTHPDRKPPTTATQRTALAKRVQQTLEKPYVDHFIRLRAELEADKAGLSEAWILNRLMDVADRCMQVEEVKDHEGNPTGEFKFDAGNVIRATTQLGNHLKMWVDRKEHTGDVTFRDFMQKVDGAETSSPNARLQAKHADKLGKGVVLDEDGNPDE